MNSRCPTTASLSGASPPDCLARRRRRGKGHHVPQRQIDIDCKSPPFDRFRSIRRLAAARRGHAFGEHGRHRLYVARDTRSRANVLIKVTSKPGLVYRQDLTNEIASLSTINRELPHSRYFPVLEEHGRLRDGRVYLTMSCFDEWPLATTIGSERIPARQVAHLRTTIEAAKALAELHALNIWHVNLNPMNILCRWEGGKPVLRIVDFDHHTRLPGTREGSSTIRRPLPDIRPPSCPVKRPMRDRIVLFGRGALHDARRL